MAYDEPRQHQSTHRHHGFLADGRIPEFEGALTPGNGYGGCRHVWESSSIITNHDGPSAPRPLESAAGRSLPREKPADIFVQKFRIRRITRRARGVSPQ